jgi:Peptidase family S41
MKIKGCFFATISCVALFASHNPAVAQATLDGHWLSDGYGLYADKRGDTITLKQITRISCLPFYVAKRESVAPDGEAFISRDANSEGGGPVTFKAVSVGDDLHFVYEGAVSDFVFRRTNKAPDACQKPTPNTPQSNYAIFWQTYADHYPFFSLRNTDWAAADKRVRPTINAKTKPADLYAKLRYMFGPFNDAHTGIIAKNLKKQFVGYRVGLDPRREYTDPRIMRILEKKYLTAPATDFCNKQLQYGVLKSGAAYLRINSFYDYAPGLTFAEQAAVLESALDKIMADAEKRNGLIVDVRTNNGGSDEFGNIIAGRLTPTSYLAYRKVVRNDLDDKGGRSPPQDSMVTASPRKTFFGKVVLLTGNDSISAAETFAMALLGRPSRVIRIGQPTQGVFSDVLKRNLPNGWIFGLPNEIYLTEGGRAFDGPGLIPDITTAVFSDNDFERDRDSAIDAANNAINKN